MGLDISHIQLTLYPKNASDFLYVEDWDLQCNVPLEVYSKYIQKIDELDFNKSIIVVQNDKDLEKLNKTNRFDTGNYLKIFIGQYDDQMKRDIDNFITREKLDKLELSKISTERDNVEYREISFGEPIKIEGIYYIDDIGYQRKGMSKQYYELFKLCELRGKKEDFELAYSCIEGSPRSYDDSAELKKNFKENFLDKFEFGTSLLWNSF